MEPTRLSFVSTSNAYNLPPYFGSEHFGSDEKHVMTHLMGAWGRLLQLKLDFQYLLLIFSLIQSSKHIKCFLFWNRCKGPQESIGRGGKSWHSVKATVTPHSQVLRPWHTYTLGLCPKNTLFWQPWDWCFDIISRHHLEPVQLWWLCEHSLSWTLMQASSFCR